MHKKLLEKNSFTDSVYDSKITKEKASYFSKTISDVYGQRKRAFSHINQGEREIDYENICKKDLKRAQNRGEKWYYPDQNRKFEGEYHDTGEESLVQQDAERFYESMNSHKEQNMVKYYVKE